MNKTLLATLAAALVATVSVPAMAAQQDKGHRNGPRVERLMERFDANKDGAVLPDEISAQRNSMFESADADKSGALSKQELAALGDMRKAERQQAREERRADRDGDRDGKKDGERGEGRHAGKQDGKRGGEGRHGQPRFERLDTDNNGEVSAEEFAAMDAKLFERFDRNGDKKIDITDFYGKRADNN